MVSGFMAFIYDLNANLEMPGRTPTCWAAPPALVPALESFGDIDAARTRFPAAVSLYAFADPGAALACMDEAVQGIASLNVMTYTGQSILCSVCPIKMATFPTSGNKLLSLSLVGISTCGSVAVWWQATWSGHEYVNEPIWACWSSPSGLAKSTVFAVAASPSSADSMFSRPVTTSLSAGVGGAGRSSSGVCGGVAPNAGQPQRSSQCVGSTLVPITADIQANSMPVQPPLAGTIATTDPVNGLAVTRTADASILLLWISANTSCDDSMPLVRCSQRRLCCHCEPLHRVIH